MITASDSDAGVNGKVGYHHSSFFYLFKTLFSKSIPSFIAYKTLIFDLEQPFKLHVK